MNLQFLYLLIYIFFAISINSTIHFYITIENNKLCTDAADDSVFDTEIIKKFKIEIEKNQLPKEEEYWLIYVCNIKKLIVNDKNFKDIDINQMNPILFFNGRYYVLPMSINKQSLIDNEFCCVFFRWKHGYNFYNRIEVNDIKNFVINEKYKNNTEIQEEVDEYNKKIKEFYDNQCCCRCYLCC